MRCPSCRLENPPSSKRCDCGHIFGEPVSRAGREARAESELGRGLSRLVWALAALGSVVGGVECALDWSSATGAPQQAVIAAVALAWAVIPYCFARAITGVIKGS
jgi:magnesium-transporting ATPase (P-type)